MQAFSETELQTLSIGGRERSYAVQDNIRCAYGVTGLVLICKPQPADLRGDGSTGLPACGPYGANG
jgi:hypothetical protein